jgi:hypothetical protein
MILLADESCVMVPAEYHDHLPPMLIDEAGVITIKPARCVRQYYFMGISSLPPALSPER